MSAKAASGLNKRSVLIAGHRTSVSLEAEFWDALRDIAERRAVSMSELVRAIDANRADRNLSSAIRVFVLGVLRTDGANGH